MKNTFKKLIAVASALLILTLTLASCGIIDKINASLNTDTELDTDLEINVSVLNGTTGFGAGKLISDAAKGNTALNYNFTVEADAANITAALINGSVDIAALPTNAAANLYNKTGGKIKIAAVNTLGVLYLVTTRTDIKTLADLEGKTVYSPAQNPAFIFNAICKANGLQNGKNITVDTAYAQPADLRAAIVSGAVDIAVLPEPMVTIAKSANPNVTVALDLTEEWEAAYGENTLMQGCIVVRTDWANDHSAELDKFLEEYKASIDFTNADPAAAAECIVEAGVFAGKAPVAKNAIPKCNIVYIDGEEMAQALNVFFTKLHEINPKAVGDKVPDSNIYLTK